MMMTAKKNKQARSWFIVAPNILKNGICDLSSEEIKTMEYEDICKYVVNAWCINDNRISCACIYCVSSEGMEHLHIVCESKTPIKFLTVKNVMGNKIHLEETQGNKQQVEDYINKRGAFEEKGETILAKASIGELKGKQGTRTDLEKAYEMIKDGYTPKDILRINVNMFRLRNHIEEMYYMYKVDNTPAKRDIKVIVCNGESGTGKTYNAYINQSKLHGEDNVYKVTDYKHGFDRYNGESILILDEYRGGFAYHTLLTLLDCYKSDVPARYSNKVTLWDTVYISTVLPVEKIYSKMVDKADEAYDSISQLLRRITEFRYHYIIHRENGTDEYCYVSIQPSKYLKWLKNKEDTIENMQCEACDDALENHNLDIGDTFNFTKKSNRY